MQRQPDGSGVIEGSCHCGAIRWSLGAIPSEATTCNCTICRRHGALWAYGFENEDIHTSGDPRTYTWAGRNIGFHFCGTCGCVAYWSGIQKGPDGRRYGAVNLRLTDAPLSVAAVPVRQHDGFETGRDLPRDGRCVADMWF
jgi:hypothetical protein